MLSFSPFLQEIFILRWGQGKILEGTVGLNSSFTSLITIVKGFHLLLAKKNNSLSTSLKSIVKSRPQNFFSLTISC